MGIDVAKKLRILNGHPSNKKSDRNVVLNNKYVGHIVAENKEISPMYWCRQQSKGHILNKINK